MTDTALKNPIVTAVMAVKSGDDVVAAGTLANPIVTTKVSDATAVATTGSGTIATGGTSQVLLTAKTRKGYWVKNISVARLTINRGGGTAASTSFPIEPNEYFETPAFENVSTKIEIWGSITGQAFLYGECV